MHYTLNDLINLSDEFSELDDIRTQDLKRMGYNKYRIGKLASGDTPILIRTRIGHYIFNKEILSKIDALFRIDKYRELISEGQYKDAINFIVPSDIQYFSGYDYLFIYLLSYRVEVPEQLRRITKSLNIEDIFNNPNNEELKELDEEVRKSIIKTHFGFAYNFISKKNKREKNLNSGNTTLKKILLSIKNKLQEEKKKEITKISEKNYNSVLTSLNQTSHQRTLTIQESCTLKLITTLLEIENRRVIPKETQTENASLFEDIENNCFESALNKCTYKIHSLLLTDIISLINNIKNSPNQTEIKLESILTALTLKDTTNTFRLINAYLRKVGKEEYLKLTLELIKISYIENDIAFTVPMRTLIHLKNNTLDIKPDIYLSKFNASINSLSTYEASIYLSILTELQKLGLININIEELNIKLEEAKTEVFNPENRNHLSTISSIMVRNCLTLEESCDYLNLDKNTRNTVFLMFAKEYYYLCDFTNGDKLVKIIEREQDKSPRVKELLNEIRRDKNFYKNRTEEMGASLILAP